MAGRGTSGRGARELRVRVKSAKGRRSSSTRWLERQLNDPYVRAARTEGYRGRAAFKLLEIDDRFKLLRPGMRVIDLGAAPGGWSQVAAERVNAGGRRPGAAVGRVIGVDLQPVDPLPGVEMIMADFLEEDADARLRSVLGGTAHVVLSDMAPAASGHRGTDYLRITALCEAAADFARDVLEPGGAFVAKVLGGGADPALVAELKRRFAMVHHFKPPASRADSSEKYLVATGFRPG